MYQWLTLDCVVPGTELAPFDLSRVYLVSLLFLTMFLRYVHCISSLPNGCSVSRYTLLRLYLLSMVRFWPFIVFWVVSLDILNYSFLKFKKYSHILYFIFLNTAEKLPIRKKIPRHDIWLYFSTILVADAATIYDLIRKRALLSKIDHTMHPTSMGSKT